MFQVFLTENYLMINFTFSIVNSIYLYCDVPQWLWYSCLLTDFMHNNIVVGYPIFKSKQVKSWYRGFQPYQLMSAFAISMVAMMILLAPFTWTRHMAHDGCVWSTLTPTSHMTPPLLFSILYMNWYWSLFVIVTFHCKYRLYLISRMMCREARIGFSIDFVFS